MAMSRVPGRDLQSFLITGDAATPDLLERAACGVVAAMEKYWSLGDVHGDLTPSNVLCDVPTHELSFIDAGTLESCGICNVGARQWHPAVYDLAHVLADRTSVKSSIGRPDVALRKRIFIEAILRAFVAMIDSREERGRLLDEILHCARLHVNIFDQSASPRGLWHALRKQIALRRVDRTIGRLKAELAPLGASG